MIFWFIKISTAAADNQVTEPGGFAVDFGRMNHDGHHGTVFVLSGINGISVNTQ